MVAAIIILSITAFGLIWALVEMRNAPAEVELWHPMTMLLDADPAHHAETLRRYPEIAESWRTGDSPSDFLRIYPTIAARFGVRKTASEIAIADRIITAEEELVPDIGQANPKLY